MKKSVSSIALSALVFSACSSDMPSSIEDRQFAEVIVCSELVRDCSPSFSITAKTPSDTIPAYEGGTRIVLGENGVMALIFDADILGADGLKPSTKFALAGIVAPAPSDTIPGPAPAGPVQAFYRQNGGSSFAAILGGAPAPSDTIPGPGPVGNAIRGNYDADAGEEIAVWVSLKYLSDSKRISTATTHLQLSITNGKTTLASASVPVSIIAPEKTLIR